MTGKLTLEQWWSIQKKKPDTIKALDTFYDLTDKYRARQNNEGDSNITLFRIVNTCYQAAHYDPEKDPGLLYRKRMKAENDQREDLAKAALVLAMSAKRADSSLLWAMDFAERSSGVRVTRKDHTEKMALSVVAHKYFSHLEKALRGKLPELDGRGTLRWFTVGNLIFDKPLGGAGSPIETVSMLAFELTFYLRMYTAGRATDSLQTGQKLTDATGTTEGKPCAGVVTAFCNATLSTNLSEAHIKNRLKQIPKVAGITNWEGVLIPDFQL